MVHVLSQEANINRQSIVIWKEVLYFDELVDKVNKIEFVTPFHQLSYDVTCVFIFVAIQSRCFPFYISSVIMVCTSQNHCPRSFFISSVMTCLLWFAACLKNFFISSVMKVSTSQSSSPVAVGPATFGRLNDLHLYRSGVGFSGLYCSCFKVLCCGTFAWTMIKYSAKPRS